ncbi:hypothetical protein EGI22_23195 [Lacihabitans sp. LS3-19]|uniref:hypothetical protein n=1 Tax=Lacihabitans sp. LS3-19 TaxID=2487335 RepID=UPI0020CF7EE0|nr:hypothetical protein [Lacihabitans sp. LS3-19]MCP9770821.1 hypothetical protein [Lacihabitans sp. LS3-19]
MFSKDFISFFCEFLEKKGLGFDLKKRNIVELEQFIVQYFEGISEIIESSENKLQINVWKDQWENFPEVVMSRLQSLLSENQKLPARVCKVRRIDKRHAEAFLNENHLQQYAGGKIKYGLFLPKNYFRLLPEAFLKDSEEILVAVMTFSGGKKFYFGDKTEQSFELIRFASLNGLNVVGGFSKLLKFFVDDKKPGNIMTYIDADWSNGASFGKLGFVLEATMPPNFYILDGTQRRALTENVDEATVKNSGSFKYILREFS